MIEFLEDGSAQTALARFGNLTLEEGRSYLMPATAPLPRTEYEARAVLSLARRGAELPVLLLPLSRLSNVKPQLGPLTGDRRNPALEDFIFQPRPLILPDPESEALSFSCLARKLFRDDTSPPEAASELLSCGLKADASSGRMGVAEAWARVQREYGLAPVRQWQENLQELAGSPIFLAPTPIIRANASSVSRAFEIGWSLADTVEKPFFRGRGLHLLIHSELFLQDGPAADARRSFLDALGSMSRPSDRRVQPRTTPFISIKVYDKNGYLQNGTGAKVSRQLLRDFLVDAREHVRAAKGILILHDMGPWALAALDSGADVVGFRCDGSKLEVDQLWGEPNVGGQGSKRIRGARRAHAPRARRFVPPFHPEELCDGHLQDFKKAYTETGAFPTAEFVEPLPWWTFNLGRQREYRAMQVAGSLLALGKQFRTAARRPIPLSESIRGRVARMKEQDPLTDLCPSL